MVVVSVNFNALLERLDRLAVDLQTVVQLLGLNTELGYIKANKK